MKKLLLLFISASCFAAAVPPSYDPSVAATYPFWVTNSTDGGFQNGFTPVLITDFVLTGNSSNGPGAIHTGGLLQTNFSTKSFTLTTNSSILSSNGTVIRAGTFFMTNGPTQSLLYLGTNPPSSGLETAIAQGAIGSTNVLQIGVPNVNSALAVHTNGGVWIGQGLTNNGATRLVGAVQVSGNFVAASFGAIPMGGQTLSGNKISVLPKTANYTINGTSDNGAYFTSVGSSIATTNTLPAATTGQHYYFYVDVAQIMCVQAVGSDVIRYGATVSAAAGNIFGSAIGNTLHVICPKTGVWVVDQLVGVWQGPQ